MSKSLQDQLKALGLAKEPAPGPAAKHSHKASPGSPPPPRRARENPQRVVSKQNGVQSSHRVVTPPADVTQLTLEQAYVLREQQSRAEEEAGKERKRLEDLRRRQVNTAIKAIVEPHRLNDRAAELARHFMYKGRIRKVNVTLEQFKALNEGVLGLVYLSGGYHVLPAAQVCEIRALSEDHVPDLSGGAEEEEQFPVPDDLIW